MQVPVTGKYEKRKYIQKLTKKQSNVYRREMYINVYYTQTRLHKNDKLIVLTIMCL